MCQIYIYIEFFTNDRGVLSSPPIYWESLEVEISGETPWSFAMKKSKFTEDHIAFALH